jgi:hypothetical protein
MFGLTTLLVICIAIAAGVLGLWAYRRSTAPKGAGSGKSKSRDQAEQWGVRIAATKERACPVVRPFLGKEFPMAEKPVLPLRNCPFPHQCECRYIPLLNKRKHQRRSGKERRQAQRFEQDQPPRRSGKDRRKIDVDWDSHERH